MFNFLKKRYDTPIESRNYSKLYLALSAILFLGTMYSVVDEVTVRRPWKDYQKQYRDTAVVRFTQRLQDAIAAFDSAGYTEAKKNLDAVLEKHQSVEYTSAVQSLRKVSEELLDAGKNYTFAKSKGTT